MRKVITIILLSLLVIASVSASAIHSLNFAYSVHEGSHIGIDYSGSSTSPVHVYGGIYGLFALGNARPGVTAGIYLGPGFSIPLNENRSLLLQLAAAVDIPMCFYKSTIGTGIGVIADIGLYGNTSLTCPLPTLKRCTKNWIFPLIYGVGKAMFMIGCRL